VAAALVMFFSTPTLGMLLPLSVGERGLSGGWLGLFEAAIAAGLLFGTTSAATCVVARLGRYRAALVSIGIAGISLAVAGSSAPPFLCVLLLAVAGASRSLSRRAGQTHRNLAIPRPFRSRMNSVGLMANQVAQILASAVAGVALGHFTVSHTFIAFGIGHALCVLVFAAIPRYREFMNLDYGAVENWFAREYPSAFADPRVRSNSPSYGVSSAGRD